MKRFEREAKELVAKASQLRKQGKSVAYDDFSREENARMKVYNVTMRVNRLEYLKAQIGLFLVDLGSDVGHELAEKLTDDYISEVKRQAGILGENLSSLWTNKEVARIIMAQTGSATFSQRLWANMDALKAELDGVIASGIIKGDNPREMARRLKSQVADTVKNHKYVTERLARTESARVQFSAQAQSIKEAGYKYCMWHDEPKACSICQATSQHKGEHGVGVYELDKVPSIPVHPNCRCSISAYWVDEDKNFDLMGKKKQFSFSDKLGRGFRLSAKKVSGVPFEIWSQGSSKKYRDLTRSLIPILSKYSPEEIPLVVIVDSKKIPGIAAYNHSQDVLYVNSNLSNKQYLENKLKGDYFVAKTLEDVVTHELTHKKHWDSAKALYKAKPKLYNNIDEAKKSLDSELEKYLKNVTMNDLNYLMKQLSENAAVGYGNGSVNEIVAETITKKNIEDKELLRLVKEVLNYE